MHIFSDITWGEKTQLVYPFKAHWADVSQDMLMSYMFDRIFPVNLLPGLIGLPLQQPPHHHHHSSWLLGKTAIAANLCLFSHSTNIPSPDWPRKRRLGSSLAKMISRWCSSLRLFSSSYFAKCANKFHMSSFCFAFIRHLISFSRLPDRSVMSEPSVCTRTRD